MIKYKILFLYIIFLVSFFSCNNSDNKIVVKKLYKDISGDTIALNNKLYKIKKKNGYVITKKEKDSLIRLSDTLYNEIYVSNNNVFMRKGNKYGAFDDWKEIFISPKYDIIANTNIHGEFLVYNNQKAGVINYKNDTIIPLKYDRIYNPKYSEDNHYSYYHYVVEINGKSGLFQINKENSGKFVLPVNYDVILSVSKQDSTAIVSVDNKYGVVKLYSNNVVIPINYDKIKKKDGFYYLFEKNKVGVVSLKNIPETLQMFDEVVNYSSKNKCIVFRRSNKKGIYDVVNNRIVLDAKYGEITKIGGWDEYVNVTIIGWNCNNDGWYSLLNKGKYGLVNITSKELFLVYMIKE